jgi:hypothetical protein
MRIVRQNEDGGYFISNLAVNAKLSFVPVSGKARERLEINQRIRFNPSRTAWTTRSNNNKSIERRGFMLVDTDGDLRPDTYVPGTSNFAAGWRRVQDKRDLYYDQPIMFDDAWHQDPTHEHVTSGY